jgi:hypothetical protein
MLDSLLSRLTQESGARVGAAAFTHRRIYLPDR